MANKRSAGSFCSLVVSTTLGTSDSVTALTVAALGNGAECYCVANNAVYRYQAASIQTTVGDTFITPLVGSGCWFKQNAQADYAFAAQGTTLMTAAVGVTPTINTWAAIKSGTGFYSQVTASNLWSLSTVGAQISYNGPTGLHFLVLMTASMDDSNAGSHQTIQWDLTQNAALVGTSGATQSAVASTTNGTLGDPFEFVHSLILSGTSGAFYQHVFRVVSSTPGLVNLTRYNVQIIGL